MKIYQLNNAPGLYKNIKPKDIDVLDVLETGYGRKFSHKWSDATFEWDDEEGEEERDLFLFMGYIPVCSLSSKKIMEAKLTENEVEFLSFHVGPKPFYFMNVLNCLKDAINLNRSKVTYFKDKSIKWISEFVFNKKESYPLIFRVPEIVTALFVTGEVKVVLEQNDIKGITYKECKVSEGGFLSRISKPFKS